MNDVKNCKLSEVHACWSYLEKEKRKQIFEKINKNIKFALKKGKITEIAHILLEKDRELYFFVREN